tara:strand:- start:496 stop:1002 length:507 start_codon:yes stop_codon:yes gene_type:complete
MCSGCPSAYGGGSSMPKKKENKIETLLRSYSMKKRIKLVLDYYNKYPGYILAIGCYDNFAISVEECLNNPIHSTFYNPLSSTSLFIKQVPFAIEFHIKEINTFLNNSKRPFNSKKIICRCNNKTMYYKNVGLVLISNISHDDYALQERLRSNSIGVTKWEGLPLYINK